MDNQLRSNKAEPSSLFNSPEKVNGHDVVVFYTESESLIKSWSTWDLARLAPEQANYLDWFVERDEE